jgi:hypothetical protein
MVSLTYGQSGTEKSSQTIPRHSIPCRFSRAIKRYSVPRRNLAVVRAVWAVINMASSVADDGVEGGSRVRRGLRLNRTKLWWAAKGRAILIFATHQQWQEIRMSKIFPTETSTCNFKLDERVF